MFHHYGIQGHGKPILGLGARIAVRESMTEYEFKVLGMEVLKKSRYNNLLPVRVDSRFPVIGMDAGSSRVVKL